MKALAFGTFITINLGTPREQVFGIARHIDSAGLLVRSISVEGLDDWFRSVARLERGEACDPGEEILLALTFFPMHRVERIVVDEGSVGLPSVHQRFEERVGLSLATWAPKRYPDLAQGLSS